MPLYYPSSLNISEGGSLLSFCTVLFGCFFQIGQKIWIFKKKTSSRIRSPWLSPSVTGKLNFLNSSSLVQSLSKQCRLDGTRRWWRQRTLCKYFCMKRKLGITIELQLELQCAYFFSAKIYFQFQSIAYLICTLRSDFEGTP